MISFPMLVYTVVMTCIASCQRTPQVSREATLSCKKNLDVPPGRAVCLSYTQLDTLMSGLQELDFTVNVHTKTYLVHIVECVGNIRHQVGVIVGVQGLVSTDTRDWVTYPPVGSDCH